MLYIFLSAAIVFGAAICVDYLLKKKTLINSKQRYPSGTHVIISGGSKGIGKSLAKKFAELGTHVTIIARNKKDLDSAKLEIENHRRNSHVQTIRTVPLDLTNIESFTNSKSDINSKQQELLDKILGEHEKCDILINCCGSAIAARFEDTSPEQFNYMMQVNYFSAVNLTRILVPVMKARSLSNQLSSRSTCGRIVFVSSMCGLLSFFGYSAYSASKFAIVGLAEALSMELRPFDIGVTVSFPPDTDTPGFEEENKTKPNLTHKISQTSNIYSPDEVALNIIRDMRAKKFYSTVGIENKAVLASLNTFMPSSSLYQIIIDSILAGPLKIVGYFILRSWYKLVDEAAPSEIIKAEIALKCSKGAKFESISTPR